MSFLCRFSKMAKIMAIKEFVIEKVTGSWTLKDGYDLDICKYEEMNILVKETSISQKLCLNVILGP